MHVVDEAILDLSPAGEIQLEVDHGGLDVVMAEAVLDIDDGLSPAEHVDGAGVTKTVNGMDGDETLGG